MKSFPRILAGCLFLVAVSAVHAKGLTPSDRQVCDWGARIAAEAQQSKLSGVSLYTVRKRLQTRRFPKPWMRITAFGITEQTYTSASRLKPVAIRQTYYEQCTAHAVATRRIRHAPS